MKTKRSGKNILLVNPWIYDFAAYDLWIKPLGLMYVGAALRRNGYHLQLLDCLDRNHPEMQALEKPSHREKNGRGKFHREVVDKPEALSWVPRYFARYGYTEQVFEQEIQTLDPPDAILVTSIMTYWYKGVEAVVTQLHEHFPNVPILLGGVYATLCSSHAKSIAGVDQVMTGYGEKTATQWLDHYFGISEEYITGDPEGDPDLPWDLYREISALTVLTARGCPYHCTFCATDQLNNRFRQRRPESVVDEILRHTDAFKVRDVVFYDDALFVNKRRHLEVILDELRKVRQDLQFHTPNGLFARMIDPQLAEKLVASNFQTIRLSFETSNEGRRKDMNNKVSNGTFLKALEHLERAGFPRHQVEVYTLMGLPGQTESEIRETIQFVHQAGAKIRLASFTPIPGTVDYRRAVEHHHLDPGTDPLLLNNSIYPLRNTTIAYEDYSAIRQYAKDLNQQLGLT